MPPLEPIGPQPQTTSTAAAGAEAIRNESRGGGGQAGGRRKQPEPEAPEEEPADEEQDAHLDADSFAGKRGKNNLDTLFADKLPWEQEEEEKQRQAEAKRKSRFAVPPRPSHAAPRTAPAQPQPPAVPLSGQTGRQVEGTFDATAALNSTMAAWQTVRERQVQQEREQTEPQPLAPRGTGSLDNPLTRPILGRSTPLPPTPRPVREEPPAAMPLVPPIEITPAPPRSPLPPAAHPAAAEVPEFDVSLLDAPQKPSSGKTGRLPPRAPLAPRQPATARDPLPGARETSQGLTAQRDAARDRGATRDSQATGAGSRGRNADGTPAPRDLGAALAGWKAAGGSAAESPASNVPPPSWMQPEPVAPARSNVELSTVIPAAAEPVPRLEVSRDGAPVIKATATAAGCTYRVVDAGSGKPMANARIELEPVQDDMLPVYNGQPDAQGWWGQAGIPPGDYRVTVRSPGYVPQIKVRQLQAGKVDDLAILLSKP